MKFTVKKCVSYGGSQCKKSEKHWNRASIYIVFFKYFDRVCTVQ